MNVNNEWYVKYYYSIVGTTGSLFLLYLIYKHTKPKIDKVNGDTLIIKKLPLKLFLEDATGVSIIRTVMNSFSVR